MYLKMLSATWQPSCWGLEVFTGTIGIIITRSRLSWSSCWKCLRQCDTNLSTDKDYRANSIRYFPNFRIMEMLLVYWKLHCKKKPSGFQILTFLYHVQCSIDRFWIGMLNHYDDVIMTAIASQVTSLTIVNSIVYSGAHQRKHQSSASLAFVRGIHRGPVNSPHK